jgi:hypothetical protein
MQEIYLKRAAPAEDCKEAAFRRGRIKHIFKLTIPFNQQSYHPIINPSTWI